MDYCRLKEVNEIIDLIPKIPFKGLKLEDREKVERYLSCKVNDRYLLSNNMLNQLQDNCTTYYNKESSLQYFKFFSVVALIVSLAGLLPDSVIPKVIVGIIASVVIILGIIFGMVWRQIVSADRSGGERHNVMLLAYSVGAELNRRELNNVLNDEDQLGSIRC